MTMHPHPGNETRENKPDILLERNNLFYEVISRQIGESRGQDPEADAARIEMVARLAAYLHSGRFADGLIENPLLEIAEHVEFAERIDLPPLSNPDSRKPTVLHVASKVFQVGGHTRVLVEWIKRDISSNHVVILTCQDGPLPEVLTDGCRAAEAGLITLPIESSRLSRARALREMASQVKRVVLHHHPEDVIPILALASPRVAPVAFFNHAHFCFNLGATVADVTVNTLPYFRTMTERHRYPRDTALLGPISASDGIDLSQMIKPESGPKQDARIKLGLDPGKPVLLTMGAEQYYVPSFGYDFFRTLSRILESDQGFQVVVVGPRPDFEHIPPNVAADPRVTFKGNVSDPIPYYHAADIFLESFPTPSLGAFYEATIHGGAYPIPVYGQGESALRIDPPTSGEPIKRQATESEYVREVLERLMNLNETRELASAIQEDMLSWRRSRSNDIENINSMLDGRQHLPGPIPESSCSHSEDSQRLATLYSDLHLCSVLQDYRFPYLSALRLNFLAVRKGYLPLDVFLENELAFVWQGTRDCFRRIKSKAKRILGRGR